MNGLEENASRLPAAWIVNPRTSWRPEPVVRPCRPGAWRNPLALPVSLGTSATCVIAPCPLCGSGRHMSKRWAVPTGKVKWYDAEKGFGFLSDDEGTDVFLHADALPAGVTTLKGGTRVEFGVVEGRRGAQALSVRVLDPAPSVVAS